MFWRCTWLAGLAAISSAALPGATVNHSWPALIETIQIGRRVVVTCANTSVVSGKVLDIDGGSITVQRRDGTVVITRTDVVRVSYAKPRKRHILLGALIGGASGALAFWATDRGSKHPNGSEAVEMGAFLGIPAGALVGVVLPRPAVLYQATAVRSKAP